MRAVSRKGGAKLALASNHVECGGFVEEPKRTNIQFEVVDRPIYIFVCGLGDTELVVKRLIGFCEGQWTKEVPMKDMCGNPLKITECENEAVILMPGHYRIEVDGCPEDAEFPEEFDHELYGVPFEFAKCWLAARSG